jgi:hypothetical protein
MVYSQTRKTSSVASITNQNTGGGSKKAGLPYTVGRPATSSVAFRTTIVMGSALQTPTTTTTRLSRPVGSRPMHWR